MSTATALSLFHMENHWQQPCSWALLKPPSHFNQNIYIYIHTHTSNAYLSITWITERNGILLVKVWPWYTTGSLFEPSQQSISRQRHPFKRALQKKKRNNFTIKRKIPHFLIQVAVFLIRSALNNYKKLYFFITKENKSYRITQLWDRAIFSVIYRRHVR